MARRSQIKGIAGNIAQWCLSRNFDCEGYWAIGQLYAYAEANGQSEIVLDLVEEFIPAEVKDLNNTTVIKLVSDFLQKNLDASKIPSDWLKEVKVTFKFNTKYQHKYHCWGSGLGGKPFVCTVEITTDLGRTYSKEYGCNVWVHNTKRESRRYGF